MYFHPVTSWYIQSNELNHKERKTIEQHGSAQIGWSVAEDTQLVTLAAAASLHWLVDSPTLLFDQLPC